MTILAHAGQSANAIVGAAGVVVMEFAGGKTFGSPALPIGTQSQR
jgi:hypothetical protein